MRAERPLQVDRLARRSRKGELDRPCVEGVRLYHGILMLLRDVGLVEEFHRLAEGILTFDGALAGLVFFDDPELVEKGRLLHVGDVRDYKDLAKGPLEAVEGQEDVAATVGIQGTEDFVQDDEAQGLGALGSAYLGGRTTGGEAGDVRFAPRTALYGAGVA